VRSTSAINSPWRPVAVLDKIWRMWVRTVAIETSISSAISSALRPPPSFAVTSCFGWCQREQHPQNFGIQLRASFGIDDQNSCHGLGQAKGHRSGERYRYRYQYQTKGGLCEGRCTWMRRSDTPRVSTFSMALANAAWSARDLTESWPDLTAMPSFRPLIWFAAAFE